MVGRPPMLTLFPYPTLFQSSNVASSRLARQPADRANPPRRAADPAMRRPDRRVDAPRFAQHRRRVWFSLVVHDNSRSEEHTSELQSRQYLVCRFLLEKKKNHSPLVYSIIHLSDDPPYIVRPHPLHICLYR